MHAGAIQKGELFGVRLKFPAGSVSSLDKMGVQPDINLVVIKTITTVSRFENPPNNALETGTIHNVRMAWSKRIMRMRMMMMINAINGTFLLGVDLGNVLGGRFDGFQVVSVAGKAFNQVFCGVALKRQAMTFGEDLPDQLVELGGSQSDHSSRWMARGRGLP
jgi:hypothetical protein